ncbi:MAG: BolA family protein [Anaplasma ovis]
MKLGLAQNTGPAGGLGVGSGAPRALSGRGHEEIIELVREKILAHVAGAHVEVTDESRHHVGHMGSQGYAVSHIRVLVVSDRFAGMSRLDRWRLLHEVLADEIKMVHSVSFFLVTSDEQTGGGEDSQHDE